jgi:phosphohistidine phosphatase
MKTLLILRHAKTQPDAPRGDHARELIERGLRDARRMGEYIRAEIGVPDAIVTSDATRARQTAEIVAETTGAPSPILEPHIYDAGLGTLISVVRALPGTADRVVIVGHNPGFEMLADALSQEGGEPARLSTAGLALLEFDVDRWEEVEEHGGILRAVVTPKSLA